MTNNPNSLISKPDWLRVKAPQVERIGNTADLLNDLKLNTVCQEASCPNIGECFDNCIKNRVLNTVFLCFWNKNNM